MPRCFACIHCGKCGPPASDAKVRPQGYCAFCGTQNEAGDVLCATCGKPLPLPPGAAKRALADSPVDFMPGVKEESRQEGQVI